MKLICAMLLLFSIKASAQYPFEKYPAIKYSRVAFKTLQEENRPEQHCVAVYKNYRLVLLPERVKDSTNILLYYNNKLIKRANIKFDIYPYSLESLLVGDINGDGNLDFKTSFYNGAGSGLGSSRVCRLYLFGKGKHQFQTVFFTDFGNLLNNERDFDGDGNFEIVSPSYLSYKWHAYWLFDIYNYKNGKLVNVSRKYNYPIMTRALTTKPSYKITNKVSRVGMKVFSLKLPEFYQQDN